MNSIAKNIDCMLGMKEYPDKYFELAIVDPPYGIKPHSNFGVRETVRFSKSDVEWDIKPEANYFNELFRVSKNQIIWGGNYFIDNLYPTRCCVIWDKQNGENPFADCELAWTSFDKGMKIFRYFWLGSHIHKLETVVHPTQKPISLYVWLLQNYAKQGDKILDTHLGSGSSRIACYDYGFDFTGFELDKDYFDAQEKRFKDHISQTNLFK